MPDSEIEALMPTDELMKQAWVDCLRWATKHRAVLERFEMETGISVKAGSPLDGMIDAATGYDKYVAVDFIRWFNREIWGEKDGRAINGVGGN